MKPIGLVEIISALAVIATLVILIFEIRGNTNAVEANTMHNVAEVSTLSYLQLATSTDLVRAFTKMDTGEELTPIEDRQLYFAMRGYWRHAENQYFQYKAGTLNDSSWSGYRAALCDAGDGTQASAGYWRQIQPLMSPEFVEFIETCGSEES